MTFKKTIIVSIMIAGATAIVSQIVFMREFLVVFYGNEISIGIILAGWLIWGAAGSWFFGRFSDHIHAKIRVFTICQVALAVSLPATLLFIRLSKAAMGIATGEIIGYFPMMISTFTVLSVPCAIMGFMFGLACRLYRDLAGDPAESVARVYVAEAVGALSGGLLVSYLMIRWMFPFSIIFLLSFLNVAAAVALQRFGEPFAAKRIVRFVTAGVLVLATAVVLLGGNGCLRRFSMERLWAGFDVLESRNSVYGNITVTKKGPQLSFYENGLHLYTVPDHLSAEEAVHFALLEDKDPRNVLLIGGGACGLLEEILKHHVKRVDYVELDPVIISMARKYLSKRDKAFLDNPKVHIINEDGRFFIKRTTRTYDCVIISVGDPYTAQINRFYTVDFFRELSRILDPGGIVSFALTSSENYISEELGDYLRSIYRSAQQVFPEVLMVPGDTAHFLLSNEPDVLTLDTNVLMDRMRKRGVKARYVREYYLFDKLSAERVRYANKILEEPAAVNENRDFAPVSYYYATVFWGTQFDAPIIGRMLRAITAEKIWLAAVFFCAAVLLFYFLSGKQRKARSVFLAVMTTGFAEINFQIAVMLSFQVIYGYVFYKLGIIITSFMIGLALGGWLMAERMPRIRNNMAVFSWTQFSICLYPLLLPPIFFWLSRTQSQTVSWMGANIIFPFLPVVAGIIGGIQFPLANRICLENGRELGRVAGRSYGLDLLGACIGALLAVAFLVPILGIFQVCLLVALINVTVLAVLILSSLKFNGGHHIM